MRGRSNWKGWFIAIGSILFSLGLIFFSYKSPLHIGDTMPITITVVPSDSYNLNCSGDEHFGSSRCNFDANQRPQSTQEPLRPYMTVRREMFILAGVFEERNVERWVRTARRTGHNTRVTLKCRATLLGFSTSIDVRWRKTGSWNAVKDVPVARVDDCQDVP